jgi:hypothetical protein
VDLAIKNGDFPVRYVGLPEGKTHFPSFVLVVSSTIRGLFTMNVHPQKFMVLVQCSSIT